MGRCLPRLGVLAGHGEGRRKGRGLTGGARCEPKREQGREARLLPAPGPRAAPKQGERGRAVLGQGKKRGWAERGKKDGPRVERIWATQVRCRERERFSFSFLLFYLLVSFYFEVFSKQL